MSTEHEMLRNALIETYRERLITLTLPDPNSRSCQELTMGTFSETDRALLYVLFDLLRVLGFEAVVKEYKCCVSWDGGEE